MYKYLVRALCTALAFVVTLLAAQSWTKKDPRQWSADDLTRLLNDSPWAQQANAEFSKDLQDDATAPVPVPTPAQVGMPGPNGVSDGRWDGGVGRNKRGALPTLPVLVRWDSALPVRLALAREDHTTASEPTREYIITVLGLVPARRKTAPGLSQETIQGLIRTSALLPRGHAAIHPDNAKLDTATGALHLFFPKNDPITLSEKEVTFVTRFGSLTVQKRFRLKDMMYSGKLEL
jgi:hypothetical protein